MPFVFLASVIVSFGHFSLHLPHTIQVEPRTLILSISIASTGQTFWQRPHFVHTPPTRMPKMLTLLIRPNSAPSGQAY